MKFNYSVFILAFLFCKGYTFAMERKELSIGKEPKKTSTLRRMSQSFFGLFPKEKQEDKGFRSKTSSKGSSFFSLLTGKKPKLPVASHNDPKNIKRFSEKNPDPKRASHWDDSDLETSEKFEKSLEVFNQEQSVSTKKAIAIEYDMAAITTHDDVQKLIQNIINIMPLAKLDQGQKSVGLLMLYFNEQNELDLLSKLLLKIQGITAVKDSIEYTKNQGLTLLVNKNLPHINKEALISFWIEEGNLSPEEIMVKLNQDKETIQEIYDKVKKKLENQKNTAMIQELVFQLVDNAVKKSKPSDKTETKSIKAENLNDLFRSDEDFEDWDNE